MGFGGFDFVGNLEKLGTRKEGLRGSGEVRGHGMQAGVVLGERDQGRYQHHQS